MSEFENIYQEKILMLAGVDLQFVPNHRFLHLLDYFSSKFKQIDFISCINLYGNLPASLITKITKSLYNLMFDRRRIYQKGNVKHIVIRRLKLPNFLQNLIGDLWVYANLPRWLKNNSYKFCLYSTPHNFFLVSLLRKRKIFRKVFYDDCDFFPDHLDAKDPFSRKILSWKEHLAVTKGDGVLSVSNNLAHLRRSQGAKKIIVVPNGVVLKNFLEARNKNKHPPTLVYMGLLSDAWGVDLALEALPLIKSVISDIRFLIIGYGCEKQKFLELAEKLGVKDNTVFLGKKPYNKLSKYLKQADVAVALYKKNRFIEYASPLKIREYMAAGLPVIGTRIGEVEEIIEASGAGELVDNSPESIASSAIKILSNKNLRKRLSENSIRYSESFEWNRVLEKAFKFTISN